MIVYSINEFIKYITHLPIQTLNVDRSSTVHRNRALYTEDLRKLTWTTTYRKEEPHNEKNLSKAVDKNLEAQLFSV